MNKSLVMVVMASILAVNEGYASNPENEDTPIVRSRIMDSTYGLAVVHVADLPNFNDSKIQRLSLKSDTENLRTERSAAIFISDGVVSKTCISPSAIVSFNPDTQAYKQNGFWNLENGLKGMGSAEYIFCSRGIDLTIERMNSNNVLYDIGGHLRIKCNNMKFGKVLFWPQGAIKFISDLDECPIARVKIIPANNQKPTLIDGSILFSQTPSVDLEVANVASISMKLK